MIRRSGRATSELGRKGLRQEYWVKSHEGRNVSVERKVVECYQWKATGQYAREDSCSFSHGTNRGQKGQLSSPAPKRRKHRLTEENRSQACKKTSKESVRIRRAIFGMLPYVKLQI